MHNPVAPIHTLELGGKTYNLRYSHGDFATAQYLLRKQGWDVSWLGPGSEQFWSTLSEDSDFKIGQLLFAGLCHADRTLTLEDAQGLITFDNASVVADTVMRAVMEALAPIIERARDAAKDEAETPLPSGSGGQPAGQSPVSTSGSANGSSGDSPLPNLTPSAGGAE